MQSPRFETMNQTELSRRVKNSRPQNAHPTEGLALVNVLSQGDFAKAHIPSSINIPVGSEDEFAKRYTKDKEIVVYCASSDCDASHKVAKRLADMGFRNVYDYEAGMRDWKQSGGAVETGQVSQ